MCCKYQLNSNSAVIYYFRTKPIFISKTQKYTNNKGLEVGKTYYYKVRGFKYVNDEKVYTEYSLKAWRTVK